MYNIQGNQCKCSPSSSNSNIRSCSYRPMRRRSMAPLSIPTVLKAVCLQSPPLSPVIMETRAT